MANANNGSPGDRGRARSVTEVNALTGALVRAISGAAYGFVSPDAMALSGDDLFAANSEGTNRLCSMTELNTSPGALVRVISGPQ